MQSRLGVSERRACQVLGQHRSSQRKVPHIRLIGAVLLEANDEWQLQHRYMQTEPMAELMPALIDATTPQITTVAA